jgi:uncharacterized protein DUF3467
MAEESSQQARPQQEGITQKLIESADTPVIYTNTARVTSSFYDVQIVFSEVRQTGPSEVTTRAHVAVVMSPEHAKALAEALNTTIEQYEAQFGKLRSVPTTPSTTL